MQTGQDDQDSVCADASNTQKIQRCIKFSSYCNARGLVVLPLPYEVLQMVDAPGWIQGLQEAQASVQRVETRLSCDKFRMAELTNHFPAMEVLHALKGPVEHFFGLDVSDLVEFTTFAIKYGFHGFVNKRLQSHTDNSLLTLNLCLENRCQGAAVRFEGASPRPMHGRRMLRGKPGGSQTDYTDVDIPSAWILLHWGDHRHQTLPIEGGERWNVIMWFKSRHCLL